VGARAESVPGAAARLFALVNQQRAEAGLPPLAPAPALDQSAQSFSEYMASADFFAHVGPDGATPLARMTAAGFPGTGAWGEDLAVYYDDPDSVMQVWMVSPPHRANILNPAFTHVGIGVAFNPNSRWKYYWTLDFGVLAGGAGSETTGAVRFPPPSPPALSTALSESRGGRPVAPLSANAGAVAGSVSFSGAAIRVVRPSSGLVQVVVPTGNTGPRLPTSFRITPFVFWRAPPRYVVRNLTHRW
jgi:hypothetical protein